MTSTQLSPRPLRLPPNIAWRSYLGGRELRVFRGLAPGDDDHFPEDWLASTTHARNGENSQSPDEGISRVEIDGELIAMPNALARWPELLWGSALPSPHTGALIKLLDSSTRLHIQAHPDAAFVKKTFGEPAAGKTECWYILATRGAGYVYLGFQHAPTPAVWERLIEEQDIDGMLACFEKIPVQPGDCFVVPAGTPHAIGEGVLMVELQEPTDWVVRCEFEVGGHRLPHDARYMGLELKDCMEIFDFTEFSTSDVQQRFFQAPRCINKTDAFAEEQIIDSKWRDFFRLRRVTGTGDGDWQGGELIVLIVTKGEGDLSCGGDSFSVRAGETWLLPGAAKHWHWEAASTSWQVLLAQPPG